MKVAGTCVIADGKFQPSGISGEVTAEVTLSSPRDARRLELSVCYHTGQATFARLSSYLLTITISLRVIHRRRPYCHLDAAHRSSSKSLRSISEYYNYNRTGRMNK